jgi:uncharacterized SAM-binding protein YcdF (DUF218 family)
MFYILSKTVYIVLMPLFWVLLLLLIGIIGKKNWRRKAVFTAFLLLYILSNPYLSNKVTQSWEAEPVLIADIKEKRYDVGIVLSGVMNNFRKPDDRFYIETGADRIMHTVLLYKEGIIKNILITGGYYKLGTGKIKNESEQIKNVMLLSGIPDSVITIEGMSRNTRENALFTAEILKKDFPQQKYLLITSAFHIPRSVACFEKVGIKADTFPVDFLSYNSDEESSDISAYFIPTHKAFMTSSRIIHETVGYVVYKISGYL